VTERRQSAEARYRRLFEAAADGILIADANHGEIVDVNPAVVRLFGYPRSLLIGTKFWDCILFRGSAVDRSLLRDLTESEAIQRSIFMPLASGERLSMEILCNRYSEGDTPVIQFNIRDVTARRRMEAQLQREDEQARQTKKTDAVGRLAGGLAHDFNNLVTAILGYCDLLGGETAGGGKDREQLIGNIRTAGERAAMLTRQLLAFGRRQVTEPVAVDLNGVVTEMHPLLKAMLDPNVQLRIDPAPSVGVVKVDRGQLEQAILNMVLTAQDAISDRGEIVVETANVDVDEAFSREHPAVPEGSYVTLRVKDTGSGMSANTARNLFEPFITTKEQGMGAGLGLATTYDIVRQAGGHIWAYCELGLGSTFSIYLPRVLDTGEKPDGK